MALVLADRVRDTTTTTGTGTVTLSGTAPTGYQNFSVIGNGNTCYYTINGGSEWEVGIGTYSSTGPTLARTTVLSSSNSGSLVNFSAGTKDVFVTYPAEKSVYQDADGDVGIGTNDPAYRLDVASADTTPGLGYAFRIRANATAGGGTIQFTDSGATAQWGFLAVTSAGVTIDATDSRAIAFRTGNAERGRFDSNGFFGVNVTPSAWQSGRSVVQVGAAAVDTGGSAQAVMSANRYFDGTNDKYINSAAATAYQQLNGTHVWYRAASGTAGNNISFSENARIDTSGNLLVGTTTTKNRLTVTAGANTNSPTLGSAGGIAYFTNTDVAYGLNVGNSASDGRVWFQSQRTDGSATAYNITLNEAGGNVGIGTNSISYKLEVGGDVRIAGGGGDLRIQSATGTTSTGGDSQIYNDANNLIFTTGTTTAERFRIGSAGQFGLSGANYGSSGQALVSQGSGAAPTWLSMGVRSNGQNVISGSTTLGSADKGTNILIVTSGITITFPSSGYASGEGVAISNISGGNVTLSFPGGSDIGGTLPNNGSFFAFCDGGGFWRQYCYSTSRL